MAIVTKTCTKLSILQLKLKNLTHNARVCICCVKTDFTKHNPAGTESKDKEHRTVKKNSFQPAIATNPWCYFAFVATSENSAANVRTTKKRKIK